LEPDGLGNISDRIAAAGPSREDAGLGLTLRPNGSVTKADAGMPPAGIWQNEKRITGLSLALPRRVDSESRRRFPYFVFGESQRRPSLPGGELMVNEGPLRPVQQFVVVLCR